MLEKNSLILMIPIVTMIAVFAFVSVAVWTDNRRKEREAFYRSELLRKLAEVTPEQAQQLREGMREDEANQQRRLREGLKLAGVIVTLVGLGIGAMLAVLGSGHAWAAGLVPFAVGVALLVYAFLLAPRPPSPQG
jgi:Flp pilus assembly protein TadB